MKKILCALYILSLLLISLPVSAQSARKLALAGVVMPDERSMFENPAFSHQDFGNFNLIVPVPLGFIDIINALTDDSGNLDLLLLLDAVFQYDSLLFNPTSNVFDFEFEANLDGNGMPNLKLNLEGNDAVEFLKRLEQGINNSLEVPIAFNIAGQTFAINPFLHGHVKIAPQGNFKEDNASVDLENMQLKLIGGISADWFYALNLSEWLSSADNSIQYYAGIRVAPFIGIGYVDTFINQANLRLDRNDTEASYVLDAAAFSSLLFENGWGLGLDTNIGAAAVIPLRLLGNPRLPSEITIGFSVKHIGLSYWTGKGYSLEGTGSSNNSDNVPLDFKAITENRFVFAPYINTLFHGSYKHYFNQNNNLTVAADVGFNGLGNTIYSELGIEGIIKPRWADNLALRAGVGYEYGLKGGIGVGVNWDWVWLDSALHAYPSSFSTGTTYGIAISASFKM